MSSSNINDNDNDDIFSDDEVPEQDVPEELEESDNELDEETRRIIYAAAARNLDMDFFSVESKSTKKPNQEKPKKNATQKSGKKSMSLDEFNKKVEAEEKAKKPVKFVSKRATDKKKQLGLDEPTQPKRQFNARLPPYNFVHKKVITNNNVKINDIKEFPSL